MYPELSRDLGIPTLGYGSESHMAQTVAAARSLTMFLSLGVRVKLGRWQSFFNIATAPLVISLGPLLFAGWGSCVANYVWRKACVWNTWEPSTPPRDIPYPLVGLDSVAPFGCLAKLQGLVLQLAALG